MIGQRFGKLIIIEKFSYPKGIKYKCVCECGNKKIVRSDHLKSGSTTSCGCYRIELNYILTLTHGQTRGGKPSKEYYAWQSMKQRCYNKNDKGYDHYGGRGIKVCDRWLDSFENFLADVGKAPSPNHSIDRIDNDGNYESDNIKWSTKSEQANNRSNSKRVFK